MRLCAKCERTLERELRRAFRELAEDILAQGPGADAEAAIARAAPRLDVARGLFDQVTQLIERVKREELEEYLARAQQTARERA